MQKSSSKPEVDVLLATYNGERYLNEQIASLQKQEGVIVRVWANDDASSDRSLEILECWQNSGFISGITKSERIGSTSVFLKLLAMHEGAKYIAFCDQDDIWESNKLILQVNQTTESKPTLVFSKRKYIDSFGKFRKEPKELRIKPSFQNALIENIAPGNTMLLNSAAISLINTFEDPAIAHFDSWIYLLISAFGECHYISSPLVNYRIHANNSIGLRKIGIKPPFTSVKAFATQASYFNKVLGNEILPKNREELIRFLKIFENENAFKRIIQILRTPLIRQSKIDVIGIKIILTLGVAIGKI